MKLAKLVTTGLLAAGITSAPIAANDHDVSYDDAMKCGALYIVLTASVEGEPEEAVLEDIATRWVAVAMQRDGTEDGSKAQSEIVGKVEELNELLEGFGDDRAGAEDFATRGVEWCDGKQQMIAGEFDSFEIE